MLVEQEKRDPTLFANNVRNKIALALGIPVTDHSFEDVQLMSEVRRPCSIALLSIPTNLHCAVTLMSRWDIMAGRMLS